MHTFFLGINQFCLCAKYDFSTFKKIMPFCEVFGLDRRRFWKNNLYWNYQCLLNACKYVYESMFCYICMQTSRPITIVLVLFVNQSHALGFFFPSKSWLAINLALRLNVMYCCRVILGVEQSFSVAKPPLLRLNFS